MVETDDLPAEAARQEGGAARDVEDARRRERCNGAFDPGELAGEAGPLDVGEAARAEIPVVVLGRPALVVLLHEAKAPAAAAETTARDST